MLLGLAKRSKNVETIINRYKKIIFGIIRWPQVVEKKIRHWWSKHAEKVWIGWTYNLTKRRK